MKIIKRNGIEVDFDINKIKNAISKANLTVNESERLSDKKIEDISFAVMNRVSKLPVDTSVETIQDIVEEELDNFHASYQLKKNYIIYRYQHNELRKTNTTDQTILSLINCENEEVKQENSNKNPVIISTQRDYMAGEVSKDLVRRYFMDSDLMKAHDEGLIHIHDMDYIAQNCHNCDLINLEDMLMNGTVISGTKIDKPHSFSTACNIATQIIAQVASSQYGGQSISLTHLAPFVQISRNSIRKEILEDFPDLSEEKLSKIVEKRLHKEIEKGVQIIQYQVVTLMTTNGQAPFITVFMYLNEAKDEQTKNDLALIIEEVLKQRIIGVKNEKGVFITPAFPKLIYVLQKDNIYPDGKYFYLSELAAKCTAKRLVPDYISEKIMKELKEGNTFPVMGCLEGKEVVTYKIKKRLFVTNIRTMWNNILNTYGYSYSKLQPNNPDVRSRFIDCRNLDVEIYDSHEKRFVKMFGANRNVSTKFVDVNLSNGRSVTVTEDHPFTTTEADIVLAKDLKPGMQIESEYDQYSEDNGISNDKLSWLFGLMITDGCYDGGLTVSLGYDEADIRERFISYVKDEFGCGVNVKLQDRGHKGKYYDLTIKQNTDSERLYILKRMLRTIFSGKQKNDRQIPSYVFETSKIDRISMLAGMIDGDGYINHESGAVQIGSTNKTLALQQMMLAQSCGMPAKIYKNHYNKHAPSMIRYRVEFLPSEELIAAMSSEKKKNNINTTVGAIKTPAVVTVISVEENDYVLNSDGWAYSYDITTESEHFTFSGIYSHNCRSCLSPWKDENGNYKFYGRFNQGVCTINLIDIACSSEKNVDKFWKIFDERLEMCKRVLMIKHQRLLGTKSDVAPILWQNGALARLKKGETIDKLLFGGYSTISLGYAGLYECVYYMTGKSHTDPSVKEFALSIMQHLNDACDKWKHETNIGFSVYGTPLESVTYKFAKCLKKRFGVIPEVTDHDYITNSYHVNVREKIDAFEKLSYESEFQRLSPGGAISYVEVPNMQNNIPAVIEIMRYIYENIMYAELNTKSDYCHECGYNGEIVIEEDKDHKLFWKCPNCGNIDQSKMNVARRTCGYIGTNFWNQGRTQEIKDRVLHL